VSAGRLREAANRRAVVLLSVSIAVLSSCTARDIGASDGQGTSGDAASTTSESSTSESSTTADTTGPGFGCIVELGPHPDADPNNSESGPTCAAQTERSCAELEECMPLYGRPVDGCSSDGVPMCASPTSLEYLGCIAFVVCKNGVNFYSDAKSPPSFYVTPNGCIPYGFEPCEVPEFTPPDDGLPPTCGEL
jgi:hypothetical protein